MANGERTRVAVFGAGIAGLTAAHELVERGFEVIVYEPAPPSPVEKTCSIGGMARTQVARIERPGTEPKQAPAARMQTTDPAVGLGHTIMTFEPESAQPDADAQRVLDRVAKLLRETPHIRHVLIRGWTAEVGAQPTWGGASGRIDRQRADAVLQSLQNAGVEPERLEAQGWGFGWPESVNVTNRQRSYVDLRIEEDLVPGEHGFRFFPSFYRHVFDTMLRIPISAEGPAFVESGQTVLDNVIPTYSQGVNFEDRKSFVLPRRPVGSFQEAFDLLKEAFDAMGFTATDAQRLGLKLFKYMTSSPERRRGEYEDMSWWDFVEGDRYTERFQRYIDSAPQLLVAMRAKESDARTMGNIAVQLMLDQVTGRRRTDGTLNAPTTLAWFEPWRRYLENQGVEFERGLLVGFDKIGDDLVPVVRNVQGEDEALDGVAYSVVALSPQAAQRLIKDAGLHGGDCDKILRLDLGDPTRDNPGGIVDHLSGIQYYFRSDVKFVPGHTVFPDSAWGLSTIAQPQFWARRRGWWDGYLGLISVDIGDWHSPSPETGKTAWNSTKQEIAEEVWRQIRQTLPENERIPDPVIYHLDENIRFDSRDPLRGRPVGNSTPLIINRTGRFDDRPGKPDHYRLYEHRIVFAGTYMQTHTRMTTMEAANESGRHAVNAILKEEKFEGDRCMIANPEKYEIDDLKWLVDLDRQLWELQLPHFIDILRLDDLPGALYSPAALAQMLAPYLGAPARPAAGLRVTAE